LGYLVQTGLWVIGLVRRHDRPSTPAADDRVLFLRVVFDLYVVSLICLVGFIGELDEIRPHRKHPA